MAAAAAISTRADSIILPNDEAHLIDALLPLHGQVRDLYRELPWPEKLCEITVFTQVAGGLGDIAAAAKAIAVMQEMSPHLHFDWLLSIESCDTFNQFDPTAFAPIDPKRVKWRVKKTYERLEPADFLLTGPVCFSRNLNYQGPGFNFFECAHHFAGSGFAVTQIARSDFAFNTADLHQYLFSSGSYEGSEGELPMGLQKGTGIFLDSTRINAPRSWDGVCCPSYILKLTEPTLRKDVLEALRVEDETTLPDYNKVSMSCGYAHHSRSWGLFIDCVATHEPKRDVAIVLNRKGEGFRESSFAKFAETIFTPERLARLRAKGYTEIALLEGNEKHVWKLGTKEEKGRRLSIVVRPCFSQQDMWLLQQASERILTTGDNSAIEAWCSRCILYLYEDIKTGCKWRFLQQQVDLAKEISPNLSRLLALFGSDRRLPQETRDGDNSEELEALLRDPNLGAATLKLCEEITNRFSFAPVLEGALKRRAWHTLIPGLNEMEIEALWVKEFATPLINYLRDPASTAGTSITPPPLEALSRRIHEAVSKHLQTS